MSRKRKRLAEKKRRHHRHARVAGVAAATMVATAATAAGSDAALLKVENTNDSGDGSLRRAINAANNTSATDKIVFESGLSGQITLDKELPEVTNPVNVIGPGRKKLSVSGDDQTRILTIQADSTISGLTLEDGNWISKDPDVPYCHGGGYRGGPYCYPEYYGRDGGGAILLEGDAFLRLDRVAVTGNSNSGFGAVYAADKTELRIEDSVFSGNQDGGVAASNYSEASVYVEGSTFRKNKDTALRTNGADATVRKSKFIGNLGGGIVAFPRGRYYSSGKSSDVVITGSRFRKNSRSGSGGAVSIDGDFHIARSSFFGNQAFGGSGGALAVGTGRGSVGDVVDSTISGNIAESGGGIQVGRVSGYGFGSSSASLKNLTVTRNFAAYGPGGGINTDSFVTADSLTVTGNRAKPPAASGGGGWNQRSVTSSINNSIISGNSSTDGDGDDLGNFDPSNNPYNERPAGNLYLSFSLIGDTGSVPVKTAAPGSNFFGVTSPGLRPLADNGGPTKTRLPKPSSPAVNGGLTELTTDQRGFTRPVRFLGVPFADQDGADGSDIGAVELRRPAFTFGKVKLNRKSGTARIFIKVKGAGRLLLAKSRLVRKSGRKAKHRSTLGLLVRARGGAARALVKGGKATVRAKVTFRSRDGGSRTKSRKVTLRRG